MSKNISHLSFKKGIIDNLFEKFSQNANIKDIAQDYLLGEAIIAGSTSFYDFLKPENKDKQVYVCNGTACVCSGKQEKVISQLKKIFPAHQIGHMTCLGRCHENGAFHYAGKNYSNVENIEKVINDKPSIKDKYHVGGNQKVLTGNQISIVEFEIMLTEVINTDPKDCLNEIKISQIRGRGGAGFPLALKLESCRNVETDIKFVICNADEGDPGAYTDRYLLEEQPLLVLFGMMVAGYITGATWGILYIRGEYPESVTIIENAIASLRDKNLLGYDILGTRFNFDFKIIKAQGAYICGEETALINSIEGQRPEVRTRPPYPTVEGLFLKPTVVNNVETLAAIYPILKNGGKWYASLGTEKSKGTKLVSLDSGFSKPGIYEVEMGTPLEEIFEDMAGGYGDIKAMQIGGPLGGIVPVKKIPLLTLDFESFKNAGFLLGHASVVCIPSDFPMIKYLEHLMDFAQYESCGKCFPCRLGTKRAHEMLSKALRDGYKIPTALFDDLLDTLEKGSLCAHGGGIPLPVKNALEYFSDELAPYFSK